MCCSYRTFDWLITLAVQLCQKILSKSASFTKISFFLHVNFIGFSQNSTKLGQFHYPIVYGTLEILSPDAVFVTKFSIVSLVPLPAGLMYKCNRGIKQKLMCSVRYFRTQLSTPVRQVPRSSRQTADLVHDAQVAAVWRGVACIITAFEIQNVTLKTWLLQRVAKYIEIFLHEIVCSCGIQVHKHSLVSPTCEVCWSLSVTKSSVDPRSSCRQSRIKWFFSLVSCFLTPSTFSDISDDLRATRRSQRDGVDVSHMIRDVSFLVFSVAIMMSQLTFGHFKNSKPVTCNLQDFYPGKRTFGSFIQPKILRYFLVT